MKSGHASQGNITSHYHQARPVVLPDCAPQADNIILAILFERCPITRPVEVGAGVGLAHGCNIRVPRNAAYRIGALQAAGQARQSSVLALGKRHIIAAFELYTYGKIIAARTPLPAGYTGMPCTLRAGNKLHNSAIAPNEKMRRDMHILELGVIGVRIAIQLIGEKLLDARAVKLLGRQADVMYHQ